MDIKSLSSYGGPLRVLNAVIWSCLWFLLEVQHPTQLLPCQGIDHKLVTFPPRSLCLGYSFTGEAEGSQD